MNRERLPNRRASITFEFQHANLDYACTYARAPEGWVAEIFLQSFKGGSGADVAARESAIAASLAPQYGTPLHVLQRALLRNLNGDAAGALGRAVDFIVQAETFPPALLRE
jgi:ribonucleoside-diphosphate reductase alpha chain